MRGSPAKGWTGATFLRPSARVFGQERSALSASDPGPFGLGSSRFENSHPPSSPSLFRIVSRGSFGSRPEPFVSFRAFPAGAVLHLGHGPVGACPAGAV